MGQAGEIQGILIRIRDKIERIRGPLALARLSAAPEVKFAARRDRWFIGLAIACAALLVLTLVLFAIYNQSLGSGARAIQAAALSTFRIAPREIAL